MAPLAQARDGRGGELLVVLQDEEGQDGMSTITQAPASHFTSAAAACWVYPRISPM